MDPADTELIFTVVVAVAAFMTFWSLWTALARRPAIEARLGALRTRRMKTLRSRPGCRVWCATSPGVAGGLSRPFGPARSRTSR